MKAGAVQRVLQMVAEGQWGRDVGCATRVHGGWECIAIKALWWESNGLCERVHCSCDARKWLRDNCGRYDLTITHHARELYNLLDRVVMAAECGDANAQRVKPCNVAGPWYDREHRLDEESVTHIPDSLEVLGLYREGREAIAALERVPGWMMDANYRAVQATWRARFVAIGAITR